MYAIRSYYGARRAGGKRVILASTEWIYGTLEESGSEQITEETPYAQNPDHLYTSSKISAELFCKNYQRLYGVPYTIIRITSYNVCYTKLLRILQQDKPDYFRPQNDGA